MGAITVFLGYTIRATKVDRCGKPIQGNANRIVTNGFIKVGLDPEMKAAKDLEQTTADGNVCVAQRTPAERKWWNTSLQLCGVDPDLYSMFMGYERILDYADRPIGFADRPDSDPNSGVVLEVWTGGTSDDDCDEPDDDAVFSQAGAGLNYGYYVFGSNEWVPGPMTVEEAVGDFTLTGKTIAIPRWARGMYNVAAINSNLDPGRLLVPVGKRRHVTFFRTPIAPPEPTDGAVPLAVKSIFTDDAKPYYGGSAVDVAPDQVDTIDFTVAVSGAPTGGSLQLLVNGNPFSVVFNSTNAQAKTALVAVDDGILSTDVTAAGGALPGTPIVLTLPVGTTLAKGTNSLTGGTSPDFTVT